jgi:hypothetical protein
LAQMRPSRHAAGNFVAYQATGISPSVGWLLSSFACGVSRSRVASVAANATACRCVRTAIRELRDGLDFREFGLLPWRRSRTMRQRRRRRSLIRAAWRLTAHPRCNGSSGPRSSHPQSETSQRRRSHGHARLAPSTPEKRRAPLPDGSYRRKVLRAAPAPVAAQAP